MDEELGLSTAFPNPGPWPIGDYVGFQVALRILCASRLQGSYHDDRQQFATVRKLRTLHHHLYERSAKVATYMRTMKLSSKSDLFRTSVCETNSLFFIRFMEGCLKRMSEDIRSDMALDPTILHLILTDLEVELFDENTTRARKRFVVVLGLYLVMSFCLSLRGNEGFMLDLQGLIQHIMDGRSENERYPHVVFPLLGCFKNEVGKKMAFDVSRFCHQ